jgi:hypothetical protein
MTVPGYWNEETREGAGQIAPSKLSDAATSAKKACFLSDYRFIYFPSGQIREVMPSTVMDCDMAFLDGHAAAIAAIDCLPGLRSGDGSAVPGWGAHQPDLFAGLHTSTGVRGRDIR